MPGCLLVLILVAALVSFGWIFRIRVLTAVGGFLVVGDAPAKADAVLVLSGDVAERVREAADLYREGWARAVVITTPEIPPPQVELAKLGVPLPEEPAIAREVAVRLGVAPGDVLQVPDPVNSTEAEARAVGAWLAGRGWRSVILVTSPYHTRRARGLFREVLGREGIDVRVVPSRHARFRAESWWRDRSGVRNLIIEYQKLLFYAVRR